MSPWVIDNNAKYEGRTIWLLTPQELRSQPAGTVVISIQGKEAIVGQDYLDEDTRYGHTAWGVLK